MLTPGCISRIKTVAGRDEMQEVFTVKVLDIFRYIVDRSFPILDPDSTDAFDIVITDGRYKTKCLLSTSLNSLVYENKLRENSVVTVTECSSLIDEESLEQVPFVILQSIQILNLASENCDVVREEIQFCEDAAPNEKQEIPLAASRGYYLPLWNDEDCFGERWFSAPDLQPVNPITNAITIHDLNMFWKALPRPFPALIGRVVSKTRLNHYGKASDEKRRYPYQAYLELEDRTATVSVCIWSSFCVLLYNYLQVGDIVALLNYRINRRFNQRSNAVYNTSASTSIEISVNPTNPTAEVYKLAPNELGPGWRLPGVPYRFIERRSLANYCSGLICDVVGVVMFVSRDSRKRKGNKSSFWTSKWVHLLDGTSSVPFILHLYASSQPQVFDAITPGTVLVCARMLLKIEAQASKHRKLCYLTTTRESQVYLLRQPLDVKDKPFTEAKAVNEVIRWRQTTDAKQLLRKSCVGGYYDFPPLPESLDLYKRTFSPEAPMDLITTVNLGFILREVHFREHLRLHIQGIVVALEFVPAVSNEESSWQSSGEISCYQLCETCHSDKTIRESTFTGQYDENGSIPSSSQTSRSGSNSLKMRKKTSNITQNGREKTWDSEIEDDSEYEVEVDSAPSSSEMKANSSKEYHIVTRRINPRRKCKKVSNGVVLSFRPVYRGPKNVRIKTRSRKVGTEKMISNQKRKAKKRLAHPPKKARRKAVSTKQASTSVSREGGKVSKGIERSGKRGKNSSSSSASSEVVKYYPFRIMDQSWTHIASDIPFLGLWNPSLHENTLPKLCSRGLTDVEVVPTADRQDFVNAEGHWRLMIAGLNRRAIVNAIFLPQYSTTKEDASGESDVFVTALATGAFPNRYPVERLLNYAYEELKERRMVFVLDLYSHGQDKVEIVINRAY